MRNKYLITLDGSDHSEYSLLWALENLVNPQNDILLLLSVGVLPAGTPCEYSAVTRNILNGNDLTKERQKAEEHAREIINNGQKLITNFFSTQGYNEVPNLNVECFVNSCSDPARYIVDFSKKQKVDVIVMGHRGTSLRNINKIGMVSQHCIHSAGCTVVITRKK
ncbi:14133_t:CDS:2 [Funneliformis geosporum]|uniref:82_t:CDS:1 n=1 Tax=Funneliformis geosporum TaxID=1117311 RepID=A0A9W4WMJ4_9GLOM|nr:14133_t:CDS:2 [Funneliformis geosporum]CAI2172567.1 82_t:CDS:2 [Funneliformis geosporum]